MAKTRARVPYHRQVRHDACLHVRSPESANDIVSTRKAAVMDGWNRRVCRILIGPTWNRTGCSCTFVIVSETAARTEPMIPDAVTFDALYPQRWEPMVRLAGLTHGSKALAEEIVQAPFVHPTRTLETVPHPSA